MDFAFEVQEMRAAYATKPKRFLILPRPEWLNSADRLSVLYEEKKTLLARGNVYYACVVQANSNLFRADVRWDCPADLLYTTDPAMDSEPYAMVDYARKIFSYKEVPLYRVPEAWREAASSVTNEQGREKVTFRAPVEEGEEKMVEFTMQPAMIFRKLLPARALCGRLLPILALPGECASVLTLPAKYWTENFREAWLNGKI